MISPFGRNDKIVIKSCRNEILNENSLMKMIALAPIEVEILLFRASEQKIGADSGISS